MTIDLYTATGEKKGTMELPASLFEAPVNKGLLHLAVVLQQANGRRAIAHVKTRGEVVGSTRKLYQQKGTGRARRGPIRSPIVRGGGKTFGPRKERNFTVHMPKKQRRAALCSSLSAAAKQGKIMGLEAYGNDPKTKTFVTLVKKLPVSLGRNILFVLPSHLPILERGARNVPGVKTILAPYLNPVDILGAHSIVFLVEALKVAEEVFGGTQRIQKTPKKQKKLAASSSQSSGSSPSSASS